MPVPDIPAIKRFGPGLRRAGDEQLNSGAVNEVKDCGWRVGEEGVDEINFVLKSVAGSPRSISRK